MEGKNCFRARWSQTPLYSGGSIAVAALRRREAGHAAPYAGAGPTPLATAQDGAVCEVLAMACGDTVNVVDATTGERLASYTTALDDLVLNVAAVYVPLSQGGPLAAPAGTYVACSTRSLQVMVFEVCQEIALTTTRPAGDDSDEDDEAEDDSAVSPTAVTTAAYTARFHMRPVQSWAAAQHAIAALLFSPCGTFLLTGSTVGGIKAWNVFHHFLTHNLQMHGGGLITTMALSEEVVADATTAGAAMPKYLAVGNVEGNVAVFNFAAKAALCAARPHVSAVDAVRFVSGGDAVRVVSVGRDRKVVSLRCQAKALVEERAVAVEEHVACAAFESASRIVIGTLDGVVSTYRLQPDGRLRHEGRTDRPAGAAAVEEMDDELCIRCVAPTAARHGAAADDSGVAEDDGVTRFYVADAAFTVRRMVVTPGTGARRPVAEYSLVGFLDQILAVRLLPTTTAEATPDTFHNCRRLVVTNSKIARIFDGVGCRSTAAFEGHADMVMCAAVSRDGRYVCTGSKDMSVRVWDAATRECIAVGRPAQQGARGHTADITGVEFTQRHEGMLLVYSVGSDDTLCVWDLRAAITGADATALPATMTATHAVTAAHDGAVHALAVAPTDQFVATGGKDKVVAVWNVVGKKVFKEAAMKGHRRAVTAVCFSPADRVLASAANDGAVRLWSLASFSCVKTLQSENRKPLLQCAFLNAGLQIVTGDAGGQLAVWALSTSEVVATPAAHSEKVWALAVAEAGAETLILSGSADGVLHVCEDYTAEEVGRIRQEHKETVESEQALSNAMRNGEFEAAFRLALRLNHPRHLRQVVAKWAAADEAAMEASMATAILPALAQDDLHRLLEFTREWLTNARHCLISSAVLACLFRAFHFTELETMPGVRGILEALVSYAGRHAARMGQTVGRMYFVDYISRSARSEALTTTAPFCDIAPRTLATPKAAAVGDTAAAAASAVVQRSDEEAAKIAKASALKFPPKEEVPAPRRRVPLPATNVSSYQYPRRESVAGMKRVAGEANPSEQSPRQRPPRREDDGGRGSSTFRGRGGGRGGFRGGGRGGGGGFRGRGRGGN